MITNVENIGAYAGRIWNKLNEEGSLRQQDIVKKSELKNNEFHLGVGWLAQENKISNNSKSKVYDLGESNIRDDIGMKAGRVYDVLSDKSKKGVAEIAKRSELRPKEVYTAIGWLAREDKIDLFFEPNNLVKYSLKQ